MARVHQQFSMLLKQTHIQELCQNSNKFAIVQERL
jgi:hypothetical protein